MLHIYHMMILRTKKKHLEDIINIEKPYNCLPKSPVDGNIFIQENISEASFRAVLCDDADERNLDGASNELSQVWMI